MEEPEPDTLSVNGIRNGILSGFQWIIDKISDWYFLPSCLLDEDSSSPISPIPDVVDENDKLYMVDEFSISLHSVSELWSSVADPLCVEENEWITTHLTALFDNVTTLYAIVGSECSSENCPEMSAPNSEVYLWLELEIKVRSSINLTARRQKALNISAPSYINYSLAFIEKTLDDQKKLTRRSLEFPSNCKELQSKMSLLLFHIVAHMYHNHFGMIAALQLHPHLNCLFIHLNILVETFSLLDEKDTTVLQDLWQKFKSTHTTELEET